MAKALIDSMTEKWNPEAYKDEYREALQEMIEDKIEHGDKPNTYRAGLQARTSRPPRRPRCPCTPGSPQNSRASCRSADRTASP